MNKEAGDRNEIINTRFDLSFTDRLMTYLNSLGEHTKKRFAPHPFTAEEVVRLFTDNLNYRLFITLNAHNDQIIAYFIAKKGWLKHDANRFYAYGLIPEAGDCTIAPSVADDWQGSGIGSDLFGYMVHQLGLQDQISRYFLWGGVQVGNTLALGFYRKLGFTALGEFRHDENNLDMMLIT